MTSKDTLADVARIFVDAERKLAVERRNKDEAERQLANVENYRNSKLKLLLELATVTLQNPWQIICIEHECYVLLRYSGQSNVNIHIVDQRETGPARN